ncbi:MAG: serpin family protein [Candidatus Pacebacteria bacterium]|nr:serpin family protein [Candidatus Paceibacterota bacterium]
MSKKFLIVIIITIILAIVIGVLRFKNIDFSNPMEFLTSLVDDTQPIPQEFDTVAGANNQFAFDLYSEYKSEKGNIFFSPYSISTALTMTYEGAKGKTAEEMQVVLRIPKDDEKRRLESEKIYKQINKSSEDYKLSTANALWAQKDYQFLEEYINNVEKYYGGKTTNLNFIKETEKSRLTINNWIENQTNNKIKNLIPRGAVNPLTRLVLTNAIYFKGTWVLQFDKKDTRDENFKTDSGQTIKVPTMKLTGDDAEFNYAKTDKVQILELPYDGGNLSMLLILPEEDNFKKLEKSINTKKLSEWKNALEKQRVDIYIPKFKFETKYFMADILKEMGMSDAFVFGVADFSGMDGTRDLYITDVIHQAFVEVNEEGTEAAAATAVVVGWGSAGDIEKPAIPIFRADHPFIFIIQQKETGNILFMGRVNNPSE